MPLIAAPARTLACARCGTPFDCAQSGACWCAAESYRLPMPSSTDEDCLCPQCLRKAAEETHSSSFRDGANGSGPLGAAR